MRNLKYLGFIILAFAATSVRAQSISGTVKDNNGAAKKAATITLLSAKDSSSVKYATSDDKGFYDFKAVAAGKYFITISHVGYSATWIAPFDMGTVDKKMETVQLKEVDASLAAVVVTAKRPIVEVKADKMIVNVEGTVNAVGNDALELLRKSPGVMVDKDDNLSLSGKNGVQVFIDGKPTPLSGADLANYLKSMQSANIDAIEIITNPGAKYEASGNAGIINIKLKKNKSFGTNGTVNAGYNIGTYAKYNGGFSVNNRNAKTNLFANYNYNKGLSVNKFNFYRTQADSIFDQKTIMKRYSSGHSYKAGADFFLTKEKTLGFIVNGNISNSDSRSKGPMDIIYAPTKVVDRVLLSQSDNNAKNSNVNFNVNYRYAKPSGSEWNVDADYGYFDNDGIQYQPNLYYTPAQGQFLYSNIYRMLSPSKIKIASLKSDYEQNAFKGRLGYGGKVSYVETNNDFRRFDVENGIDKLDRDRSNEFIYKENVNAGYFNYSRALKGIGLQVGLRIENTDSKGVSLGQRWNNADGKYENYDSSLHRNYTDFFPSAAVTFNKNPMSQFNVTYSRRIDRPAYQDLNPFEFKINDYTFMKGNTNLKPQYTNSFGVTHTYKYKLNSTLNYSHVKDIFAQIPDTAEKSKSFLTKRNLATQDIVSLNVSYPFSYKKFSAFFNTNAYYSKYKADYGGGDRVIDLDVVAVTFYMQNTYALSKKLKAELSGFYSSPSVWQGVFKSKSIYGVDAGLQQTVLQGKGTLKATVSDLFHTMKWSGTSNFAGQTSTASGRWESRQFKLNFSYRFGNSQVKAARQRKTAIDDESKRASGTGGTTGGVGGQ